MDTLKEQKPSHLGQYISLMTYVREGLVYNKHTGT